MGTLTVGMEPGEKEKGAQLPRGDQGKRSYSTFPGGSADEFKELVELERGASLSHFMILERLGEGGMGVVYSAYDPDLDRKVAIKLLSPTVSGEGRDSRVARLFREAQAMARLSHPNVATVYEVGLAEEQVYIAMELVDGVTLRDWLDAEERSTQEIVALFIDAGRGLEAAHEAGLVHRDFKPRNVMIGTDGRVRVLDFGLARPGPESSEERDGLEDVRNDVSPVLEQALTQAGAVVGTPAYMAPEQYLGQAVDERTDQFSFCVALYEALYGELPFSGDTVSDLSDEVIQGRVREPPPGRSLSASRRRILERGLQRARGDRYPSMGALLEELARDPRAARRRVAVVGALVALAAALILVPWGLGLWGADRPRLCQGADEQVARVWNDTSRQALQSGFEATGRPYAGATYEAVETKIDEYAAAWISMRTDACEATAARGEQSQSLLDLRVRCLDRKLSALAAFVEVYSDAPTGAALARAIDAVSSLGELSGCADAEALTAVVPLPEDPEIRREVSELHRLLEAAKARGRAGAYPEGLEIAQSLIARAESTGYLPVMAEVSWVVGWLAEENSDLETAEEAFRTAALAAARGRHDAVSAYAWSYLLHVLRVRGKLDEAAALIPVAQGWMERSGASDAERARFWGSAGRVHAKRGKLEEAKAHFDKSLAIAEEHLAPDHNITRWAVINAGIARKELGEYKEALGYLNRSLESARRALPPGHPEIATALLNIAAVQFDVGNYAEARRLYEECVPILEAAFGRDSRRLAAVIEGLGGVSIRQSRYDEAMRHYERSVAMWTRLLGPDHPRVATQLMLMGIVKSEQGKLSEGRPYLEEAIALLEKALGPEHPQVGLAVTNLAAALMVHDHWDEALPHFRRALAINEAALGPEHPAVGGNLASIGNVYVELGRPAEAVPLLERALSIRTAKGVAPSAIAFTEFQLARALWSSKRDRKRAVELAKTARALWGALPDGERPSDLATVDEWLAGKR